MQAEVEKLATKEQLKKNLKVLNDEELGFVKLLIELKQEHIFTEWDDPGTADADKHACLAQVKQLDQDYPGGLKQYYENSIKLLKESLAGKNPFDGWVPSVPAGVNLDFNSKDFNDYEAIGKQNFEFTGFVLVAGGLGERLGYNGIKVELPIEITTETCFLDYYCQTIKAFENEASKIAGKKIVLPFAIMTSDDTHAKTEDLITKNNYFGLSKDQVMFMKQGKVVALNNNDAHFAVKGKYILATKPHGHGDVHTLLYSKGVAKTMVEKFNTKWIVFFQDTNGVAMHSLPSSLGVSAKMNFAMNSITVPRRPGQAIGAITKLKNDEQKQEMTVNVEYNQLNPLLLNTGDKKGDVGDKDGFSLYPGNVNTFIIRTDLYLKVLEKTQGVIAEFVNPKYTDATKQAFKKPTRLESLMQDYPKLLLNEQDSNVGFVRFDAWVAFEAVKNNMKDAIDKFKKVGEAFSGSSGEASIYYFNRQAIKSAQCVAIEEAKENKELGGIPVKYGARVVIMPSFGVTLGDIRSNFSDKGKVSISEESTLVLDGDITIENLELNGCLILRAKNGSKITIKNLKVNNEGYSFKVIDPSDANFAEKYQIRGYVLDKKEQREIVFDDGKNHLIDEQSKI